MKLASAFLLAGLALCGGCSGDRAGTTDGPRPAPTLLIESRGVTMPLADAVRKTGFSPFIPSAQIAAVAAIPPLNDDEKTREPGIAIEYEKRGDALLLSQWPRARLGITVAGVDAIRRPCAPVAYKPGGLLWTTRDGRVMTLQPDGAIAPARIARETDRLLRAGACGRRIRTLSRPLPTRRPPVVSLPRQSAS